MDLWLYVYGNGDLIYNILTSVNFFMHNGVSFFKLAALISLVMFAVESTGIMPTRGYDWSKFFKVYVLLSVFVITPYPGKVTVHDVITNQDRVFNFRDGKLPFGLIFPIAITSTVMNRLINLYQQDFEIDSNLNYTYSGMNFGANFIQALDNVESYDGNFNYNLDLYMQNCGFALINKAGALSELRTSSDIFATLVKYTSTARFVQQVDFAEGKTIIVKSCATAIDDINKYYTNHSDQILRANAQMMGVSASSYDRFLNSAEATARTLLKISQGASAALKQAIGMNMLMTSLKNGAHSAGNGSLALAAYDAEQFQQYKTTGLLSGAATARTVPVLVGVGFALLFFLYPIMMFLAIAMGSYRAVGVFFQIIIAINLIPLIYEVLNFITTFYLEKKLGIVVTGQGYTYEVSTSLYSFTDNMIVAGNYLATATPLLAYAIVSGSSMALTSVFGHINDAAKQQSSQVGNEYSHGNQNIGNTAIDTHSFNNIQGNKLDNQYLSNTGVPIMKDTTSGGIHTNVGGKDYDINYKSDLLASPNFAQMATHSLENSLRHNQEKMNQLTKQWGNESNRAHNLVNSFTSGERNSSNVGADEINDLRKAQDLSSRISGDISMNGKVLGTGIGLSYGLTSSASDSLSHNLSEYKRVTNELSHSSNKDIREAYSESSRLTDITANTVQETVTTSQALNNIQSNQSAINTNLSNDFANYLRENGYSPTDMNANEQAGLAQKFVETNVNSVYGIKNDLLPPSNNFNQSTRITPKIGTVGLTRPDTNNNLNSNYVASHRAEVQAEIDKYKNHP